jgi:integrase
MGSNWFTGAVVAAPRGRIQFDFTFNGIRYHPSIKRPPSEANLRRARERLEEIKHQIRLGTFSFEEEFPDYRLLRRLDGTSSARLCGDVLDAYLAHCQAGSGGTIWRPQRSGRIKRSWMAFGALISAT